MKSLFLFTLWLCIALDVTAIEFKIPQDVQRAPDGGQDHEAKIQATAVIVKTMFEGMAKLAQGVYEHSKGPTPKGYTRVWGNPTTDNTIFVKKIATESELTNGITIEVKALFLTTASQKDAVAGSIITKVPGSGRDKTRLNFVQYNHQEQHIWFFDGFYAMQDDNERAAMLVKSLMMAYGMKDEFYVQNGKWSTGIPDNDEQGGKGSGGKGGLSKPKGRAKTVVYGSSDYQQILNQGPSLTAFCAEAFRAAALSFVKAALKWIQPKSTGGGNTGAVAKGRGKGKVLTPRWAKDHL